MILTPSHFPVQYPDLVTTLSNLKTGTVLAPNNAAFAKLLKAATAAGVELDKATVETVLVSRRNCDPLMHACSPCMSAFLAHSG